MRKKTFISTLPSGLGLTKSGRLQVPNVYSSYGDELSSYGQPFAVAGDKIAMVANGGRITKKNIGEVVEIKYLEIKGLGFNRSYIVMKYLDGTIKDSEWTREAYVLNKDEYKDALEYLKIEEK